MPLSNLPDGVGPYDYDHYCESLEEEHQRMLKHRRQRDEARAVARRLLRERNEWRTFAVKADLHVFHMCTEVGFIEVKLEDARARSAAWKRAAKFHRAWRHTVAKFAVKQITEHTHCQEDRDEAKRHLSQLLHALDSQQSHDAHAYLSWKVRREMAAARAYLQGEGEKDGQG